MQKIDFNKDWICREPSLSNRIYDTSGVAAAVTTSDYFIPRYQIKG